MDPLLHKNYAHLFPEDNNDAQEADDKRLDEELSEKVEEVEEDSKSFDIDDSNKELQQIRDLCNVEKDTHVNFEERHSGLTGFGNKKFHIITNYLTCEKTNNRLSKIINAKHENEKKVKELDNKIYSIMNILEEHAEVAFKKVEEDYQIIHHKLNREEQKAAREKNLASFDEVVRQNQQIEK